MPHIQISSLGKRYCMHKCSSIILQSTRQGIDTVDKMALNGQLFIPSICEESIMAGTIGGTRYLSYLMMIRV